MRFDDSLATVLAAETDSAFGAASAWRQIVDLIGRGRAAPLPEALDRLRSIRAAVPVATRASSARALAFSSPGPELVALFAQEELAVAAPVLRTATLTGAEWIALLPGLSPAGRSVLRHRRDLPGDAIRALESFGPTDFVLAYAPETPETPEREAPALPPPPNIVPVAVPGPVFPSVPESGAATSPTAVGNFVPLGTVALGLPVVAQAMRQAEAIDDPDAGLREPAVGNGFPISDLVARIEAFQRQRDLSEPGTPVAGAQTAVPATFAFETDATGTIRWVEGVERAPLVGLSLAAFAGSISAVDGVAAGAFRHRTPFRDARLAVTGQSHAAGAWRIAGEPSFDPESGRFLGYCGTGRRPRYDESASPAIEAHATIADSLRQLVHELRTPTNAIAGFAELIECEMLGPVPASYRARAGTIRAHAADLVAAIDDLDTAARIEGRALELRPGPLPLAPLLARVVADCQPLASLRGATLSLTPVPSTLVLDADDRGVERLIGRLLAALVSACAVRERLTVAAMRGEGGSIVVIVDCPAALAALAPGGSFLVDAEQEAATPGAPLLGVGFALRLARNLATSLGGVLAIEPRRLTLCLPAAVSEAMNQTYAS